MNKTKTHIINERDDLEFIIQVLVRPHFRQSLTQYVADSWYCAKAVCTAIGRTIVNNTVVVQ